MTKEYGNGPDRNPYKGNERTAFSPANPNGSRQKGHSHSNLEIQEAQQKRKIECHYCRAQRPKRPLAKQTKIIGNPSYQREKQRSRQDYLPGTVDRQQVENWRQHK